MFFKRTSLMSLGYTFQMGHQGRPCPSPILSPQNLTIIDLNGIHKLPVTWCGCLEGTSFRNQCMRVRWFPATSDRPSTAVTFDALEHYHHLSVQSKISFYDNYDLRNKHRQISRKRVGFQQSFRRTLTILLRITQSP